jgi:hypothetical protein
MGDFSLFHWVIVVGLGFALFHWIRGRAKPAALPGVQTKRGKTTYPLNVVGESHYQDALERITGGKTEDGHKFECKATLLLENSNRHDSMAVRVDISGMTVGYLSREDARLYRSERPSRTASVPAIITGGWDRGSRGSGSYGVKLSLDL